MVVSDTAREPLSWQLEYPDGTMVEERVLGIGRDGTAGLREAPRDANRLHVVNADGRVVGGVTFRPDLGERPIFYRCRSLGAGAPTDVTLDATVFGYARDVGNRIEGTLWAGIGGRIVNCPSWAIDQAMIELQYARR